MKKIQAFLFGAKEEVLKKLVDKYTIQYSKDIIAGYRNGYFKKEDEATIAQQIADSKANILFVAITSPIKENFLYQNREILKHVNFTMGVGGSFDVEAGFVKRAPLWMQRSGSGMVIPCIPGTEKNVQKIPDRQSQIYQTGVAV